jgi:hypothetical protein
MRTAQQIVDQTIKLAAKFYSLRGYVSPPGFRFWESKHPHELEVWEAACEAQRMLTDTDPEDALVELDE